MTTLIPETHWTEIDGVATVWTETRGPLFALLQFRTGFADETLVTSGRNHLLEHLVLSTLEGPGRRQNGFVHAFATGFHCSGRPDEVVGFLQGVCGALETLPVGRFPSEKRVLSAESAGRNPSVVDRLFNLRFGPAGHGLASMLQLGIESATPEDLLGLVSERFTRENAVLCLSGPPPRGLHLPLRSGVRHPPPAPSPAHGPLPAWDTDPQGLHAAASALVPRVTAIPLFLSLAGERLRDRLRTTMAVSYAPTVVYDPLTSDTAHLSLVADSDRENRVDLAGGFLDVLEGLSEVSEGQLEQARATMARHLEDQETMRPEEFGVEAIQRAAQDWLLGREQESMEQTMRACALATAADVARVGRAFLLDALVVVPGGAEPRPWMGARLQPLPVPPVSGVEIRHVDSPINGARLRYGTEGVTVVENGTTWTVRFDTLAVAFQYGDGGLALVGGNGASIALEPTLWRDGERVCREVRRSVPRDLLVQRPARSPSELPRPVTTRLQRAVAWTVAWFGPTAPLWRRGIGFVLGVAFFMAAISAVAFGGEWFLLRAVNHSGLLGALPFVLVATWLFARARRRGG